MEGEGRRRRKRTRAEAGRRGGGEGGEEEEEESGVRRRMRKRKRRNEVEHNIEGQVSNSRRKSAGEKSLVNLPMKQRKVKAAMGEKK